MVPEEKGFPNVVGIVDGIVFPFESAPGFNATAWKTKKHGSAMGCTVVCDHTGRFTLVSTGYEGSMSDRQAYRKTPLYTNKEDYFGEDQYLLADIDYDVSTTMIAPYEDSTASDDDREFNSLHEEAQDTIIYSLGWLRLKWSSLQGLTMKIKKCYDIDRVLDWIMTCLILHNLCLTHPDGLGTGDVYINWKQHFENVTPSDFEYHIENIGSKIDVNSFDDSVDDHPLYE